MRAKTGLAVEIAKVDRDRFNEAVAAGHYPCAPRTLRGTTRLFEVEDVVALWVYGRLIDEGVPPRNAGSIVCDLLNQVLKNDVYNEVAEEVVEVRTWAVRFFVPSNQPSATVDYTAGAPVSFRRTWPLGRVRREIIERLEWERDNLGADD